MGFGAKGLLKYSRQEAMVRVGHGGWGPEREKGGRSVGTNPDT